MSNRKFGNIEVQVLMAHVVMRSLKALSRNEARAKKSAPERSLGKGEEAQNAGAWVKGGLNGMELGLIAGRLFNYFVV